MKFSDFEKGKKHPPVEISPPKTAPEKTAAPAEKNPRAPISFFDISKKKPAPLLPANPAAPASLESQKQAAHKIYGQAILVMKALLKDVGRQPVNTQNQLNVVVAQLLEAIKSNNRALLILTSRSTASNYLYAHSVNLSILAMKVGLGLRWPDDQLHILGLSALLHDIGMIKYLGLSAEPRALTPEEHQEVRLHPTESQRLLAYIHDIEETVKHTISLIIGQAHERKGGAGYPKAAKLEDIHMAAQIIGICDMYEALSHQRSWREPLLSSDAVKFMIKKHSQEFARPLLQAFLEQVSLFPPGSYVQLTTGEVGCVVETHSKMPTRPCVEVRVSADRSAQVPPILVDLSQSPLTHIQKPVDETKLNLKDKKLLLAFQSNRWWVE